MLVSTIPSVAVYAETDTNITYTEPYLLTLDPDSEMEICWLTSGSGEGSIEIGETADLGRNVPAQQYRINGLRTSAKADGYDDELFGIKLSEVTSRLFVPVRTAAEAKGAEVIWNADDPQNPVVVIIKDGNEIKIPVNKNIAYVNGSEVKLDGVTVFNGLNTYVPQSAIDLIK